MFKNTTTDKNYNEYAFPINCLKTFEDLMGEIGETFLGGSVFKESITKTEYHISNKDSQSKIYFKVPGIKKSDIKINIENHILTVEVPKKNWYDIVMAKSPELVKSSFKIGSHIDIDSIESKLEDGVLEISINGMMDKKDTSRKIEIK